MREGSGLRRTGQAARLERRSKDVKIEEMESRRGGENEERVDVMERERGAPRRLAAVEVETDTRDRQARRGRGDWMRRRARGPAARATALSGLLTPGGFAVLPSSFVS